MRYETVLLGEVHASGLVLDLRIARDEAGAYWTVTGGARSPSPFATIAEATHSLGPGLELDLRADLAPRKGERACTICGAAVLAKPRYPARVCAVCVLEASSLDGRPLRFENASLSGGFVAIDAETGEHRSDHEITIRGIRCRADEAKFGGIVVERIER